MASDSELIIVAATRLQQQAPALANLRLVFGLELTAGGLTGPAEADRYRVELPGPKVAPGPGEDERLKLSIPGAMFRLLAEEGDLADFKEAFFYGHLQVEGDRRVLRLLGRAIDGA